MRRNILFMSMLLIAFVSASAQLKVETSGNVRISKNTTINGAALSDSIGLNVKIPQSSAMRNIGIYSSFSAPFPFYGTGCQVGLFGQVLDVELPTPMKITLPVGGDIAMPFKFNAGVAGIAASGIGVYGAIGSSLPTSITAGNYAGYFSGSVKVTGTLTATTVNTTSDSRLKDNISPIDAGFVRDILSQLSPVSYTLRNDSNMFFSSEEEYSKTHYGLIAQEIKEIVPELVCEDGSGILSINYTEIIPLLIKAIQDLSTEVETLKAKFEDENQ